ncbi:MAG: hypothetical protein WBV94_34190 [Blastocatellia bacterium]
MKTRIVIVTLIMLALGATAAPATKAQNCKSPAQIVNNIWKKWGDTIIAVGCVAKSAAATAATAPVTGGASLVATATLSATCIKNTQKYKEAIEKMVSLFNDLADNGPATLGPRRIEFGNLQTGVLLGPMDRTFVSVYPMDKDSVTFRVKKVEGESKVEVVICKINTQGTVTNLAVFETDDDDPDGKEYVRTVTGVSNHLVQIRLNGKSAVKKFKYQFRATK